MGEHDFFSFSFSFFFPFFFSFSSRKLPPSSHAPIRHLPRETSSIDYSSILAEYRFLSYVSLALPRDIDFFSPRKNGENRVAFPGKKNPKKEYAENLVPNFSIRTMKLTLNLIWTNFESDRFNEAKTVRIRAGGV